MYLEYCIFSGLSFRAMDDGILYMGSDTQSLLISYAGREAAVADKAAVLPTRFSGVRPILRPIFPFDTEMLLFLWVPGILPV